MAKCPHRDDVLGMNELISRRDFLDGMLMASTAMAVSAVCPFAPGAQSPQQFPAGWTAIAAKATTKVPLLSWGDR